MLGNVGRQLHDIVSWRVSVPSYDLIDVISFSYVTPYAFHGVLSRRIIDILLLQSCFPCLRVFSFSVVFVSLRPVSSGDVSFAYGATVGRSTGTVFLMLSSSIPAVVGVTSITRNSPVLAPSSLLYDLVSRRSAANRHR